MGHVAQPGPGTIKHAAGKARLLVHIVKSVVDAVFPVARLQAADEHVGHTLDTPIAPEQIPLL